MPDDKKWILYALLGALFAAVSNVLSKPALDKMDVSAANTVRAVSMLVVLGAAVTVQGKWPTLAQTPPKAMSFIILAGVAAGMSWLFGYAALQLTTVNNSYPIDKLSVVFGVLLAIVFLGERPGLVNWVGIAMILAGGYLVVRD